MTRNVGLWARFIYPAMGHFRRNCGQFLRHQFPAIKTMNVCEVSGSIHCRQSAGLRLAPERLTILNIDEYMAGALPGSPAQAHEIVIFDGKTIPFANQHFYLLLCNSVIEYGPVEQRAALARELIRVARRVFCQTPAYAFPVERHFLMPVVQWLPKGWAFWRVLVSPWRRLARPTPDQIHSYFFGSTLLRRSELQALFPTALIPAERVLGLTKSHYVLDAGTAGAP